MEYGRVVKRALFITWHHKILWVFGIAVALFGGRRLGGGGGGQGIQYTLNGTDVERWMRRMPGGPMHWGWEQPVQLAGRILPVVALIVGVLLIAAILWTLAAIVVKFTAHGSLIGMVNQIEESEQVSFKAGLGLGWKRFLRLFVIDLIIGVVMFFIVILLLIVMGIGVAVIAVPSALIGGMGRELVPVVIIVALLAGLVLALLFILVAFALSALSMLVGEFSARACVIEGRGIFDSLSRGVALTRGRLQEGLLMWLLMAAIGFALAFLAIPGAVLGAVGTVAPALAVYGMTQSVGAAILAAVPSLVVLFVVSLFVSGFYVTFRSAVWTLTFRELRGVELLEPVA